MSKRYSEDFFESESNDLGEDFADALGALPARSAAAKPAKPAPAGDAKIRIKPMPDVMAQKFPGAVSVVMTFEGGRQVIYLRKRG